MHHAFSWEWSDCADSSIRGNEERSSLATWLHRIVVNAALMKLRTRRRKPEASLDELMPRFDDVGCRIEPRWDDDEPVDELLARREAAGTSSRSYPGPPGRLP